MTAEHTERPAQPTAKGLYGGRMKRLSYALFVPFALLLPVYLPMWYVFDVRRVGNGDMLRSEETYAILGALVITGLFQIFATSILAVRRLNDAGKDRTLAVLLLFPPANVILLVYLLFVPSEKRKDEGDS